MRFEHFTIDGFGHFASQNFADLSPGINIIIGPNEAGKSTILAFLTYLLFSQPRGERRYEPLAGGEYGGWAKILISEASIRLERTERRGLTLYPTDGRAPDVILQEFLGGIDRSLYRSIFAFDLFSLQEFEHLSREELRDRIFTAGVLGAGRSAGQVLGMLEKREQEIFRPRAECSLRRTDNELKETKANLAKAQQQASKHHLKIQELVEAEHRIEACRIAQHQTHLKKERTEQLLHSWEAWCMYQEAQQKLENLSEWPILPIERAKEVGLLRQQKVELETKLAQAERELMRVKHLMASLERDIPSEASEAAVGAFVETLGHIRKQVEMLPRCQQQAIQTASAVKTALAQVGLGWDIKRVCTIERSNASRMEARRYAEELPRRKAQLQKDRLEAQRNYNAELQAIALVGQQKSQYQTDPKVEMAGSEIEALVSEEREQEIRQQQRAQLTSDLEVISTQIQQILTQYKTTATQWERLPDVTDGLKKKIADWELQLAGARSRWKEALHQATVRRKGEERKLNEAKQKIEGLAVDLEAENAETEVVELLGQQGEVEQEKRELEQLRQLFGESEHRIALLQEQAGIWGKRLEQIAPSLENMEAIRQTGVEARIAEEEHRTARRALEEAEAKLVGLPMAESLEDAGTIEEKHQALLRLRAALADRAQITSPAIPSWAFWGATITVAVSGGVAGLEGSVFTAALTLVVALGLGVLASRLRADEGGANQAQREREVKDAASVLGLPPSPTQLAVEQIGAEIEAARVDLARRADRLRQKQVAEEAVSIQRGRMKEQEQRVAAAINQLTKAIVNTGLEPKISPELAIQLLESARHLQEEKLSAQQLHQKEERLHQRVKWPYPLFIDSGLHFPNRRSHVFPCLICQAQLHIRIQA